VLLVRRQWVAQVHRREEKQDARAHPYRQRDLQLVRRVAQLGGVIQHDQQVARRDIRGDHLDLEGVARIGCVARVAGL
jgi:hypothetical protein